MTVKINYKDSGTKRNSSNLVLFVDEKFNISMRKFLKKVGVTSQQKIEEAVRIGIENNLMKTNQIEVKVKLEIKELDLNHEISGEILIEDNS